MDPFKPDISDSMQKPKLDDSKDTNYRNLFFKAFEVTPLLMAILTIEDDIFIHVNQAWQDTLGYSKDEVVGRSPRELKLFADFGERQQIKEIFLESGSMRDKELRFVTKSGEIRHGLFSGDIITMENQQYLFAIAYDMTERKRLLEIEEKNRQLQEQLELDKLKAEFLTNISHDFKTPINIIFSSLQLINLILAKESIADLRQGISKQTRMMKQNCYRLIRLVNNLIDITKAGSGSLKLNLENCNIVSLIKSMTVSVADYGRYNGISIVFESEIDEIMLACDIEKVERIVLNLLSNAIKFTPQNGTITVKIFKTESTVGISIKDTGIGIPKSKQKLLFRRFYQVNNSLTKYKEGSGIGLSLAKSLAELHEGDLYINDKYSKGCEFIFELPVTILKKDKKGVSNKVIIGSDNNRYVESIKVEFSDIYYDI